MLVNSGGSSTLRRDISVKCVRVGGCFCVKRARRVNVSRTKGVLCIYAFLNGIVSRATV